MLKYFAGAYELDQQSVDAHPMYAGRLVANLLDPEPGYYNQSAYHGEKDILAIGVGGQYQKGRVGARRSRPRRPTSRSGDLKVVRGRLAARQEARARTSSPLEGSAYFTDDFQPVNRLYVFGVGLHLPAGRPGTDLAAARFQVRPCRRSTTPSR